MNYDAGSPLDFSHEVSLARITDERDRDDLAAMLRLSEFTAEDAALLGGWEVTR